jgi:hypothetical protein
VTLQYELYLAAPQTESLRHSASQSSNAGRLAEITAVESVRTTICFISNNVWVMIDNVSGARAHPETGARNRNWPSSGSDFSCYTMMV